MLRNGYGARTFKTNSSTYYHKTLQYRTHDYIDRHELLVMNRLAGYAFAHSSKSCSQRKTPPDSSKARHVSRPRYGFSAFLSTVSCSRKTSVKLQKQHRCLRLGCLITHNTTKDIYVYLAPSPCCTHLHLNSLIPTIHIPHNHPVNVSGPPL